MQLATLQAAARVAYDRAQKERMQRRDHDAILIEGSAIEVLQVMVQRINGLSGWLNALRYLLDMAMPLSLDALATTMYPLTYLRLKAMLLVPEVENLTSHAQLQEVIRTTIHNGAPDYNLGDARACAIRYWSTALTLVRAPAIQEMPVLQRARHPLYQAVDVMLPRAIGDDAQAVQDFAWWMRHALDAAFAVQ